MTTIESTPAFAAAVYARMERTLAVVRHQLGRPLGLADKILLAHLDDPSTIEGAPQRSQFSPLRGSDFSPLSSGGEGGQGGEERS